MFRRPRNRPPALRFPRARKRARPGDTTPFEFTQKIESGLSAILGFFGDMTRVLYRLFRHPLTFDRYADARGNLAPSVRPFTFLALTAFLATTAVRALTTSMLLVMLSFARCSAPETQEDVVFPSMSALLKLPSVEDVLLTALPSVLLTVMFLTLCLRAFKGGAVIGRGKALNLSLYIVGVQYLLLAFAVSWSISGGLFNKAADNGPASPFLSVENNALVDGYIIASALFVVAWPALLMSTLVFRLLSPTDGPTRGRAARIARTSLAALSLSLGTLAFGLLISMPLSRFDLARQAAPSPTLEVGLLAMSEPPDPVVLRVLLTNRSARTLRLARGFFEYQGIKDDAGTVKARVVRWQTGDDYLLTIKPGDSAWVEAALDAETSPSRCTGFWNRNNWNGTDWKSFPKVAPVYWWGLGIDTYPTPETTKGRICMTNMRASGQEEPVFAFVKSGS